MTVIPPRPRMTSRYYAQGEVIGEKYELIRPLGEGGMGSVWLAKNLALDTDVALKLLRADLDADDAGERLLLEARAAARLGHRAIVRVFDFGHTEQGDPYLVMELLEGESLADVLTNRGRVSPVKAVQMLLPVVDALAAAHGRGIVHRDLKPENIFLARETRRTQPKVVDFGIAKVEQTTVGRALTQQGTVLGSPGYMSPEQARGVSGIDHRSDVWALCVVLYECVTGQPAFGGDNYNSLMRAIIEDPVVPSVDLAAGDAALWTILERGLQKDRAERWQSMRELGKALAEWLVSHGVDHDVCGEPLASWLDHGDDVAPKSRDILSVPPPSMLGKRPSRPEASQTQSDGAPADKPISFRPPGPESTSAMVNSAPPPRLGHTSVIALSAVAAVAIAASFLFMGRHSGQAASAASAGIVPASAAHAEPTPPVAPPAPPAEVSPPAPAPAPAPARVEPAAPVPVASPKALPPSAPKASGALRPAPAKKASKPAGKSELKDPY